MNDQIVSKDKFKLWKKWFWIGIVVSILNLIGGLVYGIALAIEKEHRREGLIIIAFVIIWASLIFFLVNPWIVRSGLLGAR